MPFVRLIDRRWVVNSGSVGMPYGSRGIPWALLTGTGIQLRSTSLEAGVVAEAVTRDSEYPDIEQWVQDYILQPASDADALRAFAANDGRDDTWDR